MKICTRCNRPIEDSYVIHVCESKTSIPSKEFAYHIFCYKPQSFSQTELHDLIDLLNAATDRTRTQTDLLNLFRSQLAKLSQWPYIER